MKVKRRNKKFSIKNTELTKLMDDNYTYSDYIPVLDTRRTAIPSNLFRDRGKIDNVYSIPLQFKVIKPVHVGSGGKHLDGDRIVGQMNKDSSGRPFIPGSSLKGAVSNNFLALSGSNIFTSELFGTTYRTTAISKVAFNPLVPVSDVKPLKIEIERAWRPRRKEKGVKYYFAHQPTQPIMGHIETIPPGTIMETTIQGISLYDCEAGGLYLACGINKSNDGLYSLPIKIGYGKQQGLGHLEAIIDKIQLLICKQGNLTHIWDDITSKIGPFIDAFRDFVHKIDKHRKINQYFKNLFTWEGE